MVTGQCDKLWSIEKWQNTVLKVPCYTMLAFFKYRYILKSHGLEIMIETFLLSSTIRQISMTCLKYVLYAYEPLL